MKIDADFWAKWNPFSEMAAWVNAQNIRDGAELVELLIAHDLDWSNWLIARMLKDKQRIRYAIYAAEQVVHLTASDEELHRLSVACINAAKAVLENDTPETREGAKRAGLAVRSGVGSVNIAEFLASAAAAGWAAATVAASDRADAAASAAAWAASAAAWAATGAKRAATYMDMQTKTIRYGLELLKEKK